MDLTLHYPEDRQRLEQLIRAERDAKQRDRFRVALLATQGEQAPRIVAALDRSRRFVQAWAYAYRDGGIEALWPGKSSGRPVKLAREREQAFADRIKAGPPPSSMGASARCAGRTRGASSSGSSASLTRCKACTTCSIG